MEVDNGWQWNILWSDEAHFHFQDFVNTQSCRICMIENTLQPLSLHSEKVNVCCRITIAFVVGPVFLKKIITPADPVTCNLTAKQNEELLRYHVLPTLQQCQYVDHTIFMQGGTPPYIDTLVKPQLNTHFGDDRIISHHFPIV
ncbi:transposable element tc3 transposase [Trichonephila clavipes]|nr:transposable element tc3 transposase [Trichonephila clavipes]